MIVHKAPKVVLMSFSDSYMTFIMILIASGPSNSPWMRSYVYFCLRLIIFREFHQNLICFEAAR